MTCADTADDVDVYFYNGLVSIIVKVSYFKVLSVWHGVSSQHLGQCMTEERSSSFQLPEPLLSAESPMLEMLLMTIKSASSSPFSVAGFHASLRDPASNPSPPEPQAASFDPLKGRTESPQQLRKELISQLWLACHLPSHCLSLESIFPAS